MEIVEMALVLRGACRTIQDARRTIQDVHGRTSVLAIVHERNTAAETRCEGKTRSTRARKTRSQWLCAIEKVLLQADQPMTAQEIAHAAIARQLVDPGSVWPEDTVRTLIKRHVGRDGNKLSIVIGGSERLRLYSIAKKPAD